MVTPDPGRRCPRCGAPHERSQEYCLECGSRLPAAGGLIPRLGSAWRGSLGWYPGDWIWPTLLALVVAAAAGAASAIWLTDRSSANDQTLVATSPQASAVRTTATAPESPTTTQGTATATTGEPPPPQPKPPKSQLTRWPAGRSGWTIVLDSLPAPGGRPAALAEARQALGLGMKKVGVLESARFSSLHPGYLVVFTGIYSSEADAQSAIIDAHRRGYGAAYPRRITP